MSIFRSNFNKASNNPKIHQNRSIEKSVDSTKDNYRRNVRMNLDTTAIRQGEFNFFDGKFNNGFPRPSNYPFCPQKISTVFQNGNLHWSYSTQNKTSSFMDVKSLPKLTSRVPLPISYNDPSCDVGCSCIDFSGDYVLDWSISEGSRLLSSSNPNVVLGTFDFNIEEEYFNIFLYPKSSFYTSSYVHIRYRIPIRYRYSYEDWTFWESLIIDGVLSETEFVKVVNCCEASIFPATASLNKNGTLSGQPTNVTDYICSEGNNQ